MASSRQKRGRQGVVGATLSEIVLVLLFALLLLVGGLIVLLVETQKDLADTKAQLGAIEKDFLGSEGERNNLILLLADLRREVVRLETENENLRMNLELRDATIAALNADLDSAQSSNAGLRDQVDRLTAIISGLEEGSNDLVNQLVASREEVARLAALVVVLRGESQVDQNSIADLRAEIALLLSDLEAAQTARIQIGKERDRFEFRAQKAEEELIKRQPVIVQLRETDDFRFNSGQTGLNPRFETGLLTGALPQLAEKFQEMQSDSVVLEVVGHTDEQPVGSGRTSNLDDLPERFAQRTAFGTFLPLSHADNVGLGMVRAITVARFISEQEELFPFLGQVKLVPLSAGSMVLPTGQRSLGVDPEIKNDPERRRIVLRMRTQEVEN